MIWRRDGLADALNQDYEFCYAARFLTAGLLLSSPDERLLIRIENGQVTSLNPQPTFWDPWDFEISGPGDGWAKMLKSEPPPMYQDPLPASAHADFAMGGNLELLYAHYGIVRRLLHHLRIEHGVKEEAQV
jgi:hypothetical protein